MSEDVAAALSLAAVFSRLAGTSVGLGPEAARTLLASQVGAALGARQPVADATFDALLPHPLRAMSRVHWTPMRVAVRCAELLVQAPDSRVLDIGSGVGKLCCVGALTTRAEFVGVEQYPGLVDAARQVASLLGASSASFIHGSFEQVDPADYDAFYLYNPFEENDWRRPPHLAASEPGARTTFQQGVRDARRFLAAARPGARVVTYNGMGGPMATGYSRSHRETLGRVIDVWTKDT